MNFFSAMLMILKDFSLKFLISLATSIATNGGKALIESAKNAVSQAELSAGTGYEKFELARALVIKDLSAKGLPIVINAINGAIEGAVAEMNNKK